MASRTTGKKTAKDMRDGAILQMAEAATLGMPFEVWKTRMGRHRNESTIMAFKNVRKEGGGIHAFWRGFTPKMVESATKGAVLLVAKESLLDVGSNIGLSDTTAAIAAGAGGGVFQTVVMGPCTYLVTALVPEKGKPQRGLLDAISSTYRRNGVSGFYRGGSAIAFRQATNWASRQGITEYIRGTARGWKGTQKLTKGEEAMCGVIGGTLSSWNHPFEVARIEMQARANTGQSRLNMIQVFRMVLKEQGPLGLFQGIIPRIGLNIWQTLFMVSIVNMAKKN